MRKQKKPRNTENKFYSKYSNMKSKIEINYLRWVTVQIRDEWINGDLPAGVHFVRFPHLIFSYVVDRMN